MARPMLGDLELEQVQYVRTGEDQAVTRHRVPGLQTDFLQATGRVAARIRLSGVLTRPPARDSLAALRDRFRTAAPVAFVSDITTATAVQDVLIEAMDVEEVAGRPSVFRYLFDLVEVTPADPVDTEDVVIPPPPPPRVVDGALAVRVVVEGDPAFDMDRVTVVVEATGGRPRRDVLTVRTAEDTWLDDPLPAGSYRATATVDDTLTPNGARETMTGSADAAVADGETVTVVIVLRRTASRVATVYLVHFHFDSAFVEPCMRHVLRQVADHAAAHPDQRLLIVGHTDKAGSDSYNQSLSERRARACYAWLTHGADPARSVAEWDELRRQRPAGQIVSVRDSWGTREYQHMLQALGRFRGNVGADPDLTDEAVRRFQADHGLVADGQVGDRTWPLLIEEYLSLETLAVAPTSHLPNAAEGCDSGPLRWLGCGEQDAVLDTEDAWRPNRRTEFLFVTESTLPVPVPRPVTLDLVPAGAGGGAWCLDDGTSPAVDGFVVPYGGGSPHPDAWHRRPAEEGSFSFTGHLQFEDGRPHGGGRYVLTGPTGEYLVPSAAPPGQQGEVPFAGAVRAGTPVPQVAAPDGAFDHRAPTGPGLYVITVPGPFVARRQGDDPSRATGNAVCFRLDGSGDPVIVLADRGVVAATASVTCAPAVVLPRPHTAPARVPVVLQASGPFRGSGLVEVSGDPAAPPIRLFDAATGGAPIRFDGVANTIDGASLVAGHTLFAEGALVSSAVDDVAVTLTLTGPGGGAVATTRLTVVALTLDIGLSRTGPGDPPMLPAAEKDTPGRAVQLADPGHTHERALVVVRPVAPQGFTGRVSLTAMTAALTLWRQEVPAAGQVPVALPMTIDPATVPPGGLQFFVDGSAVSASAADTGLMLGLDGAEADGDHVRSTVVQVDVVREATAAAPAVTAVRFGIWDRAFDAAGNVRDGVAEADSFVGSDTRRFHIRVRDAARSGAEAAVRWDTLDRAGAAVDAPAADVVSAPRLTAGQPVFTTRGLMIVTTDTDADQPTNSGLTAPHPEAGSRARGANNHRLRRADLDGSTRARYQAQAGVLLPLVLPVFPRSPDERRRLAVRVVRYTSPHPAYNLATPAYIATQFARASALWAAVGLAIDPAPTVDRAAPAGALDPGTGRYGGSADNPFEQAALADLIPATPDGTLTVVLVHMQVGVNAYATVAPRAPVPRPGRAAVTLGDRFFVFLGTTNDPDDETLGHELHHVLFNRFDTATGREFFAFNTAAPVSDPRNAGIALPDPRSYRRVQNQHAPEPDADPAASNVVNWVRRRRTARAPVPAGVAAPDSTTGNTLVTPF